MNLWHLAHQMLFGGLASAGFGVLFNIEKRALPFCAIAGAVALGIRTGALEGGWGFVSASFAAAFATGLAVRLLKDWAQVPFNTLGVAGCIPMIPGGFAAKAILGCFAVTTIPAQETTLIMLGALSNFILVFMIIGAIGTGLAIPGLMFRRQYRVIQSR